MKRHIIRGILLWLPVFLLAASCSKEPAARDFAKPHTSDPVMSARNVDMFFSKSGRIEARLTGPLMNRYGGNEPYMELPQGFHVIMFDSLLKPATTITANRGVRKDNRYITEAWGNVVVKNENTGEQLNTEHLVWNERDHRIWSDVDVRITRPDQILNGISLEADDSFTYYTIRQASGMMNVKQDSI